MTPSRPSHPAGGPEGEHNRLLRRVDWRFLLHQSQAPAVRDCATGGLSRAVTLAMAGDRPPRGRPDVVVLASPTPSRLAVACAALPAGGELYCEWRWPSPGAMRRAERALRTAGLTDVRLLWPWPPPWLGPAQFWLPIGSAAAMRSFISLRPSPASRGQAIARALWPLAARAGLLTPLCALARRPVGGQAPPVPDDVGRALAVIGGGAGVAKPAAPERVPGEQSAQWLLLTGGHRRTSKVVAMAFGQDGSPPGRVVKFARVPEADGALEHEARVLALLEAQAGSVPGIPRLLALGRRVGRVALVESAIHGAPLTSELTRASFPELAGRVTSWLTGLAPAGPPLPRSTWEHRLVERPREEFERAFAGALGSGTIERVRSRLELLGDLPPACEHRDCAPWNVVLTGERRLALLDWESAEPHGLPAMDLIYFLTNAALLLERAFRSGRTRETYAALLDARTPLGKVAHACWRQYCTRVTIAADQQAPLRLLCWVVHSRSEYAHAVQDCGGPPSPQRLRSGLFVGLIEEELARNA